MTAYGSVDRSSLLTSKENTTYAAVAGEYFQPLDGKMNFHNKKGIVKPIWGQLWPRQMWHYNDKLAPPVTIHGAITRFYFFPIGEVYPPILIGQLWPRGDYVANGIYSD